MRFELRESTNLYESSIDPANSRYNIYISNLRLK
jgi:hypothetical protein